MQVASSSYDIPRDLRDELKSRYPGLGDRADFWRMLGYLLFPSRVERDSGRPIISADTLAMLAGKTRQYRSRNYATRTLLNAFTKAVLPEMIYSDWAHDKRSLLPGRKARTIVRDGLDPAEAAAWRDRILDAHQHNEPGRVHLDTGRAASDKEVKRRREAIEEHIASLGLRHARRVIEHQNALPATPFTRKLNEGRLKAFQTVRFELDSPSKQQTLSTLLRISSDPKPYLKPVPRSERPFSYRPSMLTVRSDVRAILTRGWYEYDLRAAQLAIAAKLWNIPTLQEALALEPSIWQQLADALKVPLDAYKPGLKIAVYALLFGASHSRIKEELTRRTRDATVYDRFKLVPIIRQLFVARKERIKDVLAAGGVTTVFGDRLAAPKRADVRSVLAQEAQAAEVKLVLPIYDLAATTTAFKVALYQFDGVHIQYRSPAAVKTWERRIQQAVDREAAAMGVHTRLEGGLVA